VSAEVLTMPPTAPSFDRLTVDREAFRRLCVEAGGACGALQACAATLGLQGQALATLQKVEADLRAALAAAVAASRPA